MFWRSEVRRTRRCRTAYLRMMTAAAKMRYVASFILAWTVAATLLAVTFNWPAQFGGVGTDAASEFMVRGTAISAPLPPVILLVVTIVLVVRQDSWQWVAIGSASLCGAALVVGSTGEMLAAGTVDVSKIVLVFSGVTGIVIGAVFIAVTVAAVRERNAGRLGAAAPS